MPRVRANVASVVRYRADRRNGEAAIGLGARVRQPTRLAANESPVPPFPEAQRAIAEAASGVNRYPDDRGLRLREALASHHQVPADHIWLGAGTTELIAAIAQAVGGAGTSAVYGRPSFVMYKIAATLADTDPIPVALDDQWRLDLGAMAAAVRQDTSVLYLCNPNNPTGTHVSSVAVEALIDRLPAELLILVDEAYFEYVDAGDYSSAIPMAIEHPNVLVTRTFSKVYGLAGLRIGYAVCQPDTIWELQKAQIPFSVNSLAQLAALESLGHQERVAERVARNREGRTLLVRELTERGIPVADSQANFVWCRPSDDSMATARRLEEGGVIVRPFHDGWQRVTVGTSDENERFLQALDAFRVNVSRATRSPD